MITPSYGLTATERVLPRMALDFTTATLDPRVTFTRSGDTATVINSSGNIAPINADLPRFDFDPITLLCKGLLIEEARTNLFLYSAEFDNIYWGKIRSSITANATISPDGASTGDKLVENLDNGTHLIVRTETTTNTSANTWSIYAKASERPSINIVVREGTTFLRSSNATFNLSAGTVGAVSNAGGSSATAAIENAGNGWYRCSLTITLGGVDTNSQALFQLNNGSVSSYQGDGTSGIFIWGAQLEAGAFATSYIPTVASTVTRNADNVSMTGTNFSDWYNASEGTFSGTAQIAQLTGTFPIWFSANDGTLDNFLSCYAFNPSSPNMVCISQVGAVQQYLGVPGPVTVNTKTNVSFAYKSSSLASAMNATGLQSAVSGTIPTVDRLTLGSSTSNFFLNGHLQKINYWPQRLTNNEVQAFSKVG
jgi:hypothetical protein